MDFISINSNALLSKWVLFPLNCKSLKMELRLGKKSDMTCRILVLELARLLIEPSAACTVDLIDGVSTLNHLIWY